MDRQTFTIDGKTATLYPGGQKDRPLIVLNTFTGDGSSVVEAMKQIDTPDCSLLVVGELNWDHDMTPCTARRCRKTTRPAPAERRNT